MLLSIKGNMKDGINAHNTWLRWGFVRSYNHNLMVN